MAGDSSPSPTRQVLGLLDRIFLQNRSSTILLAVYLGVFFKVYEHLSQPTAAAPAAAAPAVIGLDLLEPSAVEPLTRTAALASARSARGGAGGGASRGAPVMRRSGAKGEEASSAEEVAASRMPPEDPVALLESLLAPPVAVAGEWLARVHLALGALRDGRGEYGEAAGALEAAVRAAEATEDGQEAALLGRVALGQLELRRHNYSAAVTRFEEALGAEGSFDGSLRAAALAGAGWAGLLANSSNHAEGRLYEVLNHTSRPEGQLQVEDLRWPTPYQCLAQFDGSDSYRVVALAGLSLGRSLARGAVAAQVKQAESLRACAARLLLDAGSAAEGGGEEPRPRLALGVAHLALGQVRSATRHFSRSLQEEGAGGDSALYLSLAAFASKNASLARQHLSNLPSDGGAAAAQAAESLTRFARAHAELPGGRELIQAAVERGASA